jgi:hypothetical protein
MEFIRMRMEMWGIAKSENSFNIKQFHKFFSYLLTCFLYLKIVKLLVDECYQYFIYFLVNL